jgi:hypothetical protein
MVTVAAVVAETATVVMTKTAPATALGVTDNN